MSEAGELERLAEEIFVQNRIIPCEEEKAVCWYTESKAFTVDQIRAQFESNTGKSLSKSAFYKLIDEKKSGYRRRQSDGLLNFEKVPLVTLRATTLLMAGAFLYAGFVHLNKSVSSQETSSVEQSAPIYVQQDNSFLYIKKNSPQEVDE